MIEVFFRGHGDWIIEGSNGEISHAISMENRMTHIESSFAIGWVGYRSCDEVSGIFRLTEDDEDAYLYTESLNRVKKLLPSSHPDSAFLKMATENNLSNEDAERCYFMIVEKHRRFRKVIELPYDIKVLKTEGPTNIENTTQTEISCSHTISELSNSTSANVPSKKLSPKNKKRIDSLNEFIAWLECAVKNKKIHGLIFDKYNLDCTKEDLFQALIDWEKDRRKRNDYVWNVKGWDSCDQLWGRPERKLICDIADDRRGRNNQDRESIFKKIEM